MSEFPPDSPMEYRSPPSSAALTQLKIAAIITIVAASLGWLWSLVDGGLRIFILASGQPLNAVGGGQFSPEAARALVYGGLAFEMLTVLLGPVVIFGAVQMLRRRSYGLARASAILAMLPISTFCCCFLTLPIAIWALVILNNPEVHDVFRTNA